MLSCMWDGAYKRTLAAYGAIHSSTTGVTKAVVSSSVVEHPVIVRWVVGSILYGGSNELFPVPSSDQRLVQQRSWYVSSSLWDGAYKRALDANRKT